MIQRSLDFVLLLYPRISLPHFPIFQSFSFQAPDQPAKPCATLGNILVSGHFFFFHTKWMTSSIGRISSMMSFRAPLKVKWWIIFGLHLHTKLNHPWYSPPSPPKWTPYFPSSHRCEMRERHCCSSAGCLLRRYGKYGWATGKVELMTHLQESL